MGRKKKWSELNGRQRFGMILGVASQLALQGAALRDLAKRPAEQVKGPKAAWALASLVNGAGPIAYFLFGRRHDVARTPGSGQTASSAGLKTALGVNIGKRIS
ncbi:PLD nuclease N-terminal domain-containing protein [Sinomonas halotolerans]|uniref:PLD nuclease N-terminal domain-containing protein n=1 Tax=Sinomonas halotolerans TaxID=1644133 RepID=A0ABU9X1U1_9MICC